MITFPPQLNDELLDGLLELRAEWQAAGFDAAPQRVRAARNVLLALAAQGRLPDDMREWKTWLAPIFCAAPGEQEEFYLRYDKWVERHAGLRKQVVEAVPALPDATPPREAQGVKRWLDAARLKAALRTLWARPWWWMPVVMILLAGLVWYGRQPLNLTVSGQVFSQNDQQPLPKAQVEFAGRTLDTGDQGQFAFAYQVRRYEPWLQRDLLRMGKLTASAAQHSQQTREFLFYQPGQQKITLSKRGELAPNTKAATLPLPTPTPIIVVQTYDTGLKLWQWALIVAPLALYALWLAWRWWRKRALLEKLPSRRVPPLRELKVAGAERKLFASAQVRRWLLSLRRPRPLAVRELDVAATVRATIRQGGMFTPAYRARRTSPEYLLLIDRASAHDEQADVADELRQRMKDNGLFFEAYYFQGDARACRNVLKDKDKAAVSLPQLAARYPEHRLLVFGDGAGFFDPYTGRPQRWLEQFAPWEQRALLTPEAPARWGYRERELARRDFLLLPASADGLAGLGEWLNFGMTPAPRKNVPQAAPFPPVIEERAYRWLERLEPEADEIDELVAETRAYLGPQSWDWLCACAVYPQVTWELTLWHGYWLFGGDAAWRDEWDEHVLPLVRLPWFRHGVMPDWWRNRLLNEWHDAAHETTTRRGIQRLLWSATEHPDEPVALEYAEEESWRERLGAWWQRQRLFHRVRTVEDPEDPARDTVFLRFLAGQRPPRLGVNVPEALRRLLFKDGQPALGWHPVTLGFAAGLLSLVALLTCLWLNRKDLPDQPNLNVTPPVARPTVPTNVPLTAPVPSPTIVLAQPAASPSPGGKFVVNETKEGYSVALGNNLTLELAALAGGEFTMGSDKGDDDEKPPHRVRVSPFNIGRYEVTQAQWLAVMGGKNPSYFKGTDLPVEQVSWDDAVKFCQRLSQLTGKQFRLPTEAEWEYAARADTTTEYSFGDDEKLLGDYAWFDGNSGHQTHPVGQKKPNAFGLHDMHGNVWEWCQDVWHENYQGAPTDGSAWLSGGDSSFRALRGGSWYYNSGYCRAADRSRYAPGNRTYVIGVRVVMVSRTS